MKKYFFILIILSSNSCGQYYINKCKLKVFNFNNAKILASFWVPDNADLHFDSLGYTEHANENILNENYIPKSEMIFSYVDVISSFNFQFIIYEGSHPGRMGNRYFISKDNTGNFKKFRELRDNQSKINNNRRDYYSLKFINKNTDSAMIIEKGVHWYAYFKNHPDNRDSVTYYYESYISKKRDFILYYSFKNIPFKMADSLINCYFKNGLLKSIKFKE